MKKIFYKLTLLFVAVTTCSAIFSSCKDDVLPTATRLFRPVIADDNVEAGLDADTVPYIKLKWDKYSSANQYVVKVIASDGTDSATITTDSVGCIFRNLKFDKEYNIKIHSVNTTSNLQSKDYVTNVATPDFPTQLINISTSNIIDTQVRVIWNTSENGIATVFDSLKVYSVANDSLVVKSAVASDELTSGQKIIRKLQAKTKYRVEAYQNGKYKGKKLFTTTSAESYDGLVIDLRGLTATDSYKYFSTVTGSLYANTVDSIVKANPNQNITFVLQGGVTYRLPTLIIPTTTGTIKFATGLSLNGQAAFAVSGNFAADVNGQIGGISLQKIFFADAPLETGKKKTDGNYGGTYLFNSASTASGYEIKSIKFSDCTIKYKRGIVRVQTASIVDSISIDNCVFDSIGGYGITNADNAGAQILNVRVSNSTLSNCDKLFINTKPTTYSVNQFDVINSTFVYVGTDKSVLFDFNGCKVTNGLNVNNCLFGRTGTIPTGVLLTGVTGWRGLSSPNFQSCYLTNDYKNVLGTDLITPTNPISGTTISFDTPGSFVDPTKSNFKVTNAVLKSAKAGDPRWY
jgi:hypothetical protein